MTKYRFEDIAYNSTEKKKPVEEDKYTYIGLEHLDPQCFEVTRYGSEVAPIGEKLVMKKGDVLFGKRRAYQKKVAIAPFDGIFSAHGMVLRPKEKVIDPKFFPMFIASDYFLNSAIKISVGSLSPTINWSALKELEFELPDLNKQRELAELLWAAEETQQAYKRLIDNSNKLIQAEFNKLFGNINNTPIYQSQNLTDYVEIRDELREPIKDADRQSMKEGNQLYPYYGATGCVDYIDKYKVDFDAICIAEDCGKYNAGEDSSYIISSKCWVNNHAHILKPKTDKCDITFLNFYFKMLNLNNLISGSTRAKLTKGNLEKLKVNLPDFTTQQTFANIIHKSFESTMNIANQIETINKIKKELLTQNLTKEVSHV